MENSSPDTRHLFVVFNPVAGTSTADDVRQAFERHFTQPHCSYELYETTGQEAVEEVAREAVGRGFSAFVAAGGDGTASDVAAGLVGTDIPLGIVPLGTANVLAQELGIPTDLDGACSLIVDEHKTTKIDGMQVDAKYFFLHIGIGLDAIVMRDTEREHKRRFGLLAYIWTGIARLFGYQPRRFSIVADGKRLRPRAAQVQVANGSIIGMSLFRLGTDIHPDDGQLDLCIIYANTLLDYLILGWHMLRHQPRRSRRLRSFKIQESVLITADDPLPVQGDGEVVGETPVKVQVVPHAVRIIVPLPPGEKKEQPAQPASAHTAAMQEEPVEEPVNA